jgi:uncharacterized protein YaeQ
MALTSTVYTIAAELSDVDRGVYESLDIRAAMHPSESAEYFVTRVLAYCLEYAEGIAFAAGGVSDAEEPPVLVRDLTGRITTWIEIGAPDAARLHRASKLADRVAVYSHRDTRNLLPQLRAAHIHRAAEIPLYTFDRGFIDGVAAKIERRMRWVVSVNERYLYLDGEGSAIHEEMLG